MHACWFILVKVKYSFSFLTEVINWGVTDINRMVNFLNPSLTYHLSWLDVLLKHFKDLPTLKHVLFWDSREAWPHDLVVEGDKRRRERGRQVGTRQPVVDQTHCDTKLHPIQTTVAIQVRELPVVNKRNNGFKFSYKGKEHCNELMECLPVQKWGLNQHYICRLPSPVYLFIYIYLFAYLLIYLGCDYMGANKTLKYNWPIYPYWQLRAIPGVEKWLVHTHLTDCLPVHRGLS